MRESTQAATEKAALLAETDELLVKALGNLKKLAEREQYHGYGTTGSAADKMVAKGRELALDVRRWRTGGDHIAAMRTGGRAR